MREVAPRTGCSLASKSTGTARKLHSVGLHVIVRSPMSISRDGHYGRSGLSISGFSVAERVVQHAPSLSSWCASVPALSPRPPDNSKSLNPDPPTSLL